MRPALWIPLAAPLAAALLAPGPAELREATTTMASRLAHADALGAAVGRMHGAWGEILARETKPDPCGDPATASLVARSRAFGDAYRDAVQDARAALDRLSTIEAAPTVEPLLDAADRTAFAEFRAQVGHHVSVWSEMAAWQRRFVEPTAKGCVITLERSDGIAYTGASAAGGAQPVAVGALGGGFVCPLGLPADGRIVVLPDGAGCVSVDVSCGCVPVPVLPGAVLGPG